MLFTGVLRLFQDNVNSFWLFQVPLRLLKNSRLVYNCKVFLSLFQGTCIFESNISDLNHPNKMMETSNPKVSFKLTKSLLVIAYCAYCAMLM